MRYRPEEGHSIKPGSQMLISILLTPIDLAWQIFSFIAPVLLAVILLGYFVPHVLTSLLFRQRDLKRAYKAEWALVTGASSGESFGHEGLAVKSNEFLCLDCVTTIWDSWITRYCIACSDNSK